jgi:type IV fimbrial biogenesis protein FimT
MKNRSGFTLIELMVVIGVIAILTSIATPNILAWRENAQLSSAGRQVMSAIQDVRLHAIKENSTARIEFTNPGDNFVTRKWNRGLDTWNIQTRDLPPGVQMTNNFGGGQAIFNSRGLPINPGVGFGGGTVVLNNSRGATLNVVVTPFTGNVRIEN